MINTGFQKSLTGLQSKMLNFAYTLTSNRDDAQDLTQDSSAESPEDVYGAKEITQAINTFPEEYRRPFAMHIAGYKYSEIAEKTGLPLGTVKSRIYATRKRLQKQLSDYK